MSRESQHPDPREAEAKPPFSSQQQPAPGSEAKMDPPVDHGEESYKGNQRLKGKVAILSGSDSGIGRAVAIAFAREGADLVLSYLPEEEKDAQETVRWVEEAGQRAVTAPGDIRDAGYDMFLILEATIGFHPRGQQDGQMEDEPTRISSGDLVLNTQDAKFLKSLRITLSSSDEPFTTND